MLRKIGFNGENLMAQIKKPVQNLTTALTFFNKKIGESDRITDKVRDCCNSRVSDPKIRRCII